MGKPVGNVVYISADNTKLHVGHVDRILMHLEVDAGNAEDIRMLEPEIYDAQGRLVTIGEPENGTVELALVEPEIQIAEQLLQDRVKLACMYVQVKAHESDDEAVREFRVPVIDAELPVVLAGLAEAFALGGADHPGGTFHDACEHPHF